MPVDLAAGELVRQLRRVGLRPPEKLVKPILQARESAIGPLLALATEMDLLHREAPECYAPIHALRLLGELPTTRMIVPLLEQIPVEADDPDKELAQLWADEVPQMIGRLGEAAIAPLWAFADDQTRAGQARGAALVALAFAATQAPEQRDAVVAGLRERLGQQDDRRLNAYIVIALGDLGVETSYPTVMALYRAGQIDQAIIPPRYARQLLLTAGERRLACVRHPLWERYDEHGPFEESQAAQ